MPVLFSQAPNEPLIDASNDSIIDSNQIIKLIDSMVPIAMQDYYVPGGAISVVYGNEVLYSKGFGYRDVKLKKEVKSDETVFRMASISKILTTLAVLQLVDKGLLSLDQNIETYLHEIKLVNPFKEKVTLRHLLTHTAGFDKRNVLRRRLNKEKLPSLKEHLKKRLPQIVHPPGEVMTYSNYGTALAGCIVEKVSGLPFDEYMKTHIFEPLEMYNSSFQDPFQFKDDLAFGYYKQSYETVPFEYLNTIPASMLMSTAEDMSHFLLMLVNKGIYKGNLMVSSSLLEKMLTTQMRNHPVLMGRSFGFSVYDTKPKMLFTNGHFKGFYSAVYMYPDLNLAVFFTFNGNYGYGPTQSVINVVNKNVLHVESKSKFVEVHKTKDRDIDFLKYAGRYLNTRSAFRNIEKIDNFPGEGIQVVVNEDNALVLDNGNTYFHYKDEIFRSETGDIIAFKSSVNNQPKYMLIGEIAYLKMEGIDHEYLHLGLFILLSLTSIITILWYFKNRKFVVSKEEMKLRKMAFYLASTILLFFLLLFILLDIVNVTTHYKIPVSLNITLLLPHISVLLAFIFPYYVFKFIRKEKEINIKQVVIMSFMILMLAHIWYFNYWEFLCYNI